MAGLKLGNKQAAAKPTINVAKLDIPTLLQKQLNIGPQEVQQLLMQVTKAKSPADAAMIIKQFDRNPQTMNQQFNPAQQQAQQPAAGLQLGK